MAKEVIRLRDKMFGNTTSVVFSTKVIQSKDNLKNSLEILGEERLLGMLRDVNILKQKFKGSSARRTNTLILQSLKDLGYSESEAKLHFSKKSKKDYSVDITTIYTLTATREESGQKRGLIFEYKTFDSMGDLVKNETVSECLTEERMNLGMLRQEDVSSKHLEILNSMIMEIDENKEKGFSVRQIVSDAKNLCEKSIADCKARIDIDKFCISAWDTEDPEQEEEREEE